MKESTTLFLLNENTKHQYKIDHVCQKVYQHLLSLQQSNGAIKSTLMHIADSTGYSLSNVDSWLLFLADIAVIDLERTGAYFNIVVEENITFITTKQ